MHRLIMGTMAIVLLAPSVHAAEGSRPVILRYEATADCPPAEVFVAEVRREAPTMRDAERGERALVFDVTIEEDAPIRRGRLVFTDGDRTSVREIAGASCAEVSGLLAFATALAIAPPEPEAPAPAPSRPAPAPPADRPASRPQAPADATRHDLSVTASFLGLSDNAALAPGVSAAVLYRRGLFAGGVVGDVGLSLVSWAGGGLAVGVSAPMPSWLRVDLLAV